MTRLAVVPPLLGCGAACMPLPHTFPEEAGFGVVAKLGAVVGARQGIVTSSIGVEARAGAGGIGGPDSSVRALALFGLGDHVAIGRAVAQETFPYGTDAFGMPLLDVQGRL